MFREFLTPRYKKITNLLRENGVDVIYMDCDMRLKEPENPNQVLDRDAWCPGIAAGDIIDSPMNPQLYPPE